MDKNIFQWIFIHYYHFAFIIQLKLKQCPFIWAKISNKIEMCYLLTVWAVHQALDYIFSSFID